MNIVSELPQNCKKWHLVESKRQDGNNKWITFSWQRMYVN